MNAHSKALEAAYARRTHARAASDTAAATLERGKRLSAAAADKVGELERSLATLEASQAQRLAAAITAGRPTAALPHDIDAEALAAQLSGARSHASITTKAVDSLKAASEQAQVELAAADGAVIVVVDDILDQEYVIQAEQLERLLDEAIELGKRLLFRVIASEVGERRGMPPRVTAALDRLDGALIDRRHVAVNLFRQGDQAALARCAARRASMIAGESAPVAEAAG